MESLILGGQKKRGLQNCAFPFYRDFYNTVKDSIRDNSVSFILGPWKCGKTVCLRQLSEEFGNSEYVDFKTFASGDDDASFDKQLKVFDRIFQAVEKDEDRIFLLDGIAHVTYADYQINALAMNLDDCNNEKTRIVITGSHSVALNAWANRAFGEDAGYIYADFLTYIEFMRYKGLEEASAQTFNAFLYDSATFHNITSLKEYLKGCIEETNISNEHSMEYIFENDVFLIEDKIDFLVDICCQTLFPLLNEGNAQIFIDDNNYKNSIVRSLGTSVKGIEKIGRALLVGYCSIQNTNIKTMKQALIFLKMCGLITISPITEDIERVPNLYQDLYSDYSKINYSKELFHSYTVNVTHPMFYVLILKELLKKNMPEELPGPVVKRIMEYNA